jgi:hypothetical protein
MRAVLHCLTLSCAAAALVLLTAAAPAADNGGQSAGTEASENGMAGSTPPDESGKTAESPAADNGNGAIGHPSPAEEVAQTSGATRISGPDEPETHLNKPLPQLHLTDAEHEKIRAAVAPLDTEVTFQLKATKSHKNFTPSIGGKIPPHLPAHALPSELTQAMPMLANYKYMKVKKQVLIVNPMTKKIVDMFPETGG